MEAQFQEAGTTGYHCPKRPARENRPRLAETTKPFCCAPFAGAGVQRAAEVRAE